MATSDPDGSITIRRVRADDGPAFRAIRLEAISDSPTAFGSSLAETAARPPEYWDRRVANAAAALDNVLFVAEDDGAWVGIAGGYVDELESGRSADLISMWIRPDYRGRGLGRQLVAQVIEWARGRSMSQIALWVTEGNESAIALYRSCGFQDSGEIQSLPSHPDLTERRMVLTL